MLPQTGNEVRTKNVTTFDNVARLMTLCIILQHTGTLERAEQGAPEIHDTCTASLVSFPWVLRDALTISDQYAGERVLFPAPPVDLYRPHECHYDHDEIENHDTEPGHRKILSRAMSTKNERLTVQQYPRHALRI